MTYRKHWWQPFRKRKPEPASDTSAFNEAIRKAMANCYERARNRAMTESDPKPLSRHAMSINQALTSIAISLERIVDDLEQKAAREAEHKQRQDDFYRSWNDMRNAKNKPVERRFKSWF